MTKKTTTPQAYGSHLIKDGAKLATDELELPTIPERQVYWYDIPESIAIPTGIKRVGLVELTLREESSASGRVGTDISRLANELLKESLRFVVLASGAVQTLSTDGLSAEAFWSESKAGMSKLRTLIMTAYGDIHQPEGDAAQAFLKSRRTSAG